MRSSLVTTRRRSIQTTVLVGVSALIISLMAAPTSSVAAPKLPDAGTACPPKDHWQEHKVSILEGKISPNTKGGRDSDLLVCVPVGWKPEEFFPSEKALKAPKIEPNTDWGVWTPVVYPKPEEVVPYQDDSKFPEYEAKDCRLPRVVRSGPGDIELNPNWNRRDFSLYPQGLGSWSRTDAQRVPSTGDVKGVLLNVVARNADQRAVGGSEVEWRNQNADVANYMEDYFYSQSYGALDVEVKVVDRIFEVDTRRADMQDVLWDYEFREAVMEQAGPFVDFGDADFLIIRPWVDEPVRAGAPFMFNRPLERTYPAGRGEVGVVLGTDPIYNVAVQPFTPGSGSAREQFVAVHEFGHLLGLPDLYAEPGGVNDQATRFSANLMTMHGSANIGFTGFERYVLGWIPDLAVRCVLPSEMRLMPQPDGSSSLYQTHDTVALQPIDDLGASAGGYRLVVVPISTDQAVVIEARANTGSTSGLPSEGIFSYQVNASSASARCVGAMDRREDCNEQANIQEIGGPAPVVTHRNRVCFVEDLLIATGDAILGTSRGEELPEICWSRDQSLTAALLTPDSSVDFTDGLHEQAIAAPGDMRYEALETVKPDEWMDQFDNSNAEPSSFPYFVFKNLSTSTSGYQRADIVVNWCFVYDSPDLNESAWPNTPTPPTHIEGDSHYYCVTTDPDPYGPY